MSDTDWLKKELRKPRSTSTTPPNLKRMLSTGSTLLNLACSGKASGGFPRGHYFLLVGDSTSGKTWLSLTCLAEAAANKHFDDYRFIYDNAEDGALMDIERYFGKKVKQRLEAPAGTKESPIYSHTVEDFYYHLDDAGKKGTPFIYILDSMDSVSSNYEKKKFEENKKIYRKQQSGEDSKAKEKGSYGDGKAKKHSEGLRQVIPLLSKTGSILILISQTRDNIGWGFDDKTRAGGHAPKFYATLELWSSLCGTIKKKIKGKDRQLGIESLVKVRKNRITGKQRSVTIPIYHSFGIDDCGSCVDYLLEEEHWKKKTGGIICAKELDLELQREELIQHIQQNGLEKELRVIVSEVWEEIERLCTVERKQRYD